MKFSKSFATTIPGFTATGAETVFDTASTLTYCVNGVSKALSAVTDGETPTTDVNTGEGFKTVGPDQACVFLWLIDAAGNVAVAQGPIVDVDGDTDKRLHGLQFPDYDEQKYCPFVYTIYQTNGSSAAAGLLFGTSNWNSAGLSLTHVQIMALPDRPVQP